MYETVLALMNAVLRREPQPPHGELDHLHWDRETRTWRRHEESDDQKAA